MYSYEFPRPYPLMVLCSVCLIVGLAILAAIVHKRSKSYSVFLLPIILVLLSYFCSSMYFNGIEQVFAINIYDVRAIMNGLAAVGLYHLIIKTSAYFRYRKIEKNGGSKNLKSQRLAAEDVYNGKVKDEDI